MPTISMFYGILIQMFSLDNKKHNLPHIHVKYAQYNAVFSIIDGALLEGELPNNKRKLVEAWMEIHRDDLLADWELAVSGDKPFKIEPLR